MHLPTSDSSALTAAKVGTPVGEIPKTREPAGVGRWRWAGAAGVIAGLGVLAVRDPHQTGSYGLCPLNALTGLDCPFCGGLRGTYALLHGDVSLALDHNFLLPVFLGALVTFVILAWRRSPLLQRGSGGQGGSRPLITRVVIWGLIAATALFFVLRNLPAFPYLDAGA